MTNHNWIILNSYESPDSMYFRMSCNACNSNVDYRMSRIEFLYYDITIGELINMIIKSAPKTCEEAIMKDILE